MSVIFVEAYDLWDYCKEHKKELRAEMHKIANHSDYGIDIYITANEGKIQIVVEADDEEIYREHVTSSMDCEATAERIYDTYLTSKAIEMLVSDNSAIYSNDEETLSDQKYSIDERELELDDAVHQFFLNIFGAIPYFENANEMEVLEDVKEHFLEYIARKWGVEIYRPMMLEDEDGKEFYEEYPYSCMVFEDEDNPIYKK